MKSGNLANLGRAGQLAAEPTSVGEIGRLLKSADDQLRDSGIKSALAALRAEGYRPSASRGHRKLIFHVLETTAGAPRDLWVALDSYHDRRNAAEYQGAPPATEAEAKDLVELAGKLQKLVLARLKLSHPELLK
ncbi:MAG: hypothetical protein E6H75_14340 [Betaproteobacteria bacterium]|nr:MAG: hypothetical protein E6H75_14340 [Betaproteobacteria bacterium]